MSPLSPNPADAGKRLLIAYSAGITPWSSGIMRVKEGHGCTGTSCFLTSSLPSQHLTFPRVLRRWYQHNGCMPIHIRGKGSTR